MMLSNQEIFDRHSLREWFAVGMLVSDPYRVSDSPLVLGCQVLAAMDVESQCALGMLHPKRTAAAFTATEIISFLDSVFAKHGRPKAGVVIAPLAWRGSAYLEEKTDYADAVAFARECGLTWPEMDAGERLSVALHVQGAGLRLEWEEENVPRQRQWTPVDE